MWTRPTREVQYLIRKTGRTLLSSVACREEGELCVWKVRLDYVIETEWAIENMQRRVERVISHCPVTNEMYPVMGS